MFVRKSSYAKLANFKRAADDDDIQAQLKALDAELLGEQPAEDETAEEAPTEDSEAEEETSEDAVEVPTIMEGEDAEVDAAPATDEMSEAEEMPESSDLLLNQMLGDVMVLAVKTLNFHWNVQSPHFSHVHELFGVQYQTLIDTADSIAERIRALDAFPISHMSGWLGVASIKEAETTEKQMKEMFAELVNDYITVIGNIKKYNAIMLDHLDDQGSSDFILGILFDFEKKRWMLKASAKDL